jgi:spore coat polysaccharide biosynthesis protein SpsF
MRSSGRANGGKKKPTVTSIIQARMQSKRLPGKSMLPLAGRPLLAHVIERAKLMENVTKVVVATCEGEENHRIIELAGSMGVDTFIGSMDDVLERYHLAAEKYGGDIIVRVTGDNPFTDVEYGSMIIEIAMESGSDYCGPTNLPLGTAVEVVKREILEEAYKKGDAPYHREHVTSYIKEHPELYSMERPQVNIKSKYKDIRLTVDTPEDYRLAGIIYDSIYKGAPFPLQDVFDFAEQNPEIILINNNVVQRPQSHSEK